MAKHNACAIIHTASRGMDQTTNYRRKPKKQTCDESYTTSKLMMASGNDQRRHAWRDRTVKLRLDGVERFENAVGVLPHLSHILCAENFVAPKIEDSPGEASVHKCATEMVSVNATRPYIVFSNAFQ